MKKTTAKKPTKPCRYSEDALESLDAMDRERSESVPSCLWDRPGIADEIDGYWRNSPDELAHRKRLAALVSRHAKPGGNLLEVGCGTGLVYEALNDAIPGLSYVGLDYSTAMLDIAHRRYPDAMFRIGHAEMLDYPIGWFDVAVAFEVFGHFADFTKMLDELVRVAKRTAIFSVWLGPVLMARAGEDHYEHPYQGVRNAIDWALHGAAATVTMHDMGYGIAVFVIEKVQR